MRLQPPIKKLEKIINFVPYKLHEQIKITLSSIGKRSKFSLHRLLYSCIQNRGRSYSIAKYCHIFGQVQ